MSEYQFKQIFSANELAENISDVTLKQIYVLRLQEDLGTYLKEITLLHCRLQMEIISQLIKLTEGREDVRLENYDTKLKNIFVDWNSDLKRLSKFINFMSESPTYEDVVSKNVERLNKLNPEQKEYFTDLNLTQKWSIITPPL